MVTIRIRNDEFTLVMYQTVDLDIEVPLQALDQVGLVTKELRAMFRVVRPDGLHGSFEASSILLGYAIPLLGSTKVYVVDTVEIYIFQMPGESGFPHT